MSQSNGANPAKVERILVVGYGNELRGDDGVGPHLARAVAGWQRPGVEVRAVHQLTPELAAEMVFAQRVIFIDAALVHRGQVEVVRLGARPETHALGHLSDPRWLLALALVLYGRHPETWLMTIPAFNLDYGEGFSSQTTQRLDVALRELARLLGEEAIPCTR